MDVEALIFRSDFHKCRKIFRALFARALLLCHACVAVVVVGNIEHRYYGIYAMTGVMFLLETIAILYFRYGCEWKRFCTIFLCYLCTMVPVLWILNLHDIMTSLKEDTTSPNITLPPNNTQDAIVNNSVTPKSLFSSVFGGKASNFAKMFSGTTMTSLLEQSMMIMIIICRWLLPRGRIDRNSLSQLLIMYSAISADMLDFTDMLRSEEVIQHTVLSYVILGVWTWSLVQFLVVITTAFTLRRRDREPDLSSYSSSDSDDQSETISVLMVFFMQDGPFLLTRCYAISIGVLDYNVMFFALKNAMTIILGLYRLFVLCGCLTREGNDLLRKSEIARSMESLDDLDFGPKKSKNNKRVKNGKKRVEFDVDEKANKSKGKHKNEKEHKGKGKKVKNKVQRY